MIFWSIQHEGDTKNRNNNMFGLEEKKIEKKRHG